MLTSSKEPASNRISFLKLYPIPESRILKSPTPLYSKDRIGGDDKWQMVLCFWDCVTGLTTVLDSIVELWKIAFLKPATYIFHSGCLKRCLGFVKYFRYLLSNSTEDPQNQSGAWAFLSALVENAWHWGRLPHNPSGGQGKDWMDGFSLVFRKP